MRKVPPPAYEMPAFWFPVYNEDSETCPPGAVVEIKSINASTGIAQIGKPSADGSQLVFFNSLAAIPSGKTGQATQSFPAVAAYQADNEAAEAVDMDPAHGETWGTESGSWYLHKGQNGFYVIGQGGFGLCNVQRSAPFEPTSVPGYDPDKQQLLGHDEDGVLTWYDTTQCS